MNRSFTKHNSHEEFIALLDEHEADKESTAPVRVQSSQRPIAIILIVFIVLDVFVYLYAAQLLHGVSNNRAPELEFRNSYVGLDALYGVGKFKPPHFEAFINSPRISAQISSTEPNKVYPQDQHRWLSDFGLLTPPDRHLEVSSTVHTVAQFHTVDYGMEQCTLALRLPPRDAALPDPFVFENDSDDMRLNICRLDASRSLNLDTLSWSQRPRCTDFFGILDATMGIETTLPSFPCKSGSFHTFEVSCASDSPHCQLDIWSNQNATWGLIMYQSQTLTGAIEE